MVKYRRRRDDTLWCHVWTHSSAQYPIELRGRTTTIYVTRPEFWTEYEEVA
jgi:hypothetical protein